MITVSETALYLGLPDSTVYALVRNRKIGHTRYTTGSGRGTIRIDRDEAERYRLSCHLPAVSGESLEAIKAIPARRRPIKAPLAICGPEAWGDGS
jgi:excisionase family DNA binding protein